MGRRKGRMPRRMPVLRQDHRVIFGHDRVDPTHDVVPIRHGESATRAKVVLNINDKKGVGHGVTFGKTGLPHPTG